jgi:ribulose bisphosphate carboxylase small subunit
MKKTLFTALVLFNCFVVIAQKAEQNNEQCPLNVADIERVFGKGFANENPSKIGSVFSCRFKQEDYTIQIQIQPSFGMKTTAEYNKVMSPNTVAWQPITNDPDGAMIEVRDDKKDDLASTPAIAYIRKDKYVRLQILGAYYGFDKSQMLKVRDEMRDKLSRLKRVP